MENQLEPLENFFWKGRSKKYSLPTEEQRKKYLSEGTGKRGKRRGWAYVSDEVQVLNRLYRVYRCRSVKRFGSFDLSKDQFKAVITQSCYLCGSPPYVRDYVMPRYYRICKVGFNTMDRLDSDKPYTLENVRPCCEVCNRIKNKDTVVNFLKRIERIYFHSIKDKNLNGNANDYGSTKIRDIQQV